MRDEPLFELLTENCFDEAFVDEVIDAGYFLHPFANWNNAKPCVAVMDGFYGRKRSGIIQVDDFVAYLKGETLPKPTRTTAIYEAVRDVNEVLEILEQNRHKYYFRNNSTCFRGQAGDYLRDRNGDRLLKRRIPNPYVCDADGMERMIVPSLWRDYLERPLSERKAIGTQSILTTSLADHLIYKGIDDWQHLGERNAQRYGPFHTISDLQDFPDADSQEYFKRWSKHKIEAPFRGTIPVLEQHYGMNTHGLDVTFDPLVALFFATHQFTDLKNGKFTFVSIDKGNHRGVLYFLVFAYPLRSTEQMIRSLDVFEHIPPIRPLRQKCALPGFHYNEIAAAALDLDAILYLDKNFSAEGLPEPEELFPREEDPFYMALLEEKKRDSMIWQDVVEYQFD